MSKSAAPLEALRPPLKWAGGKRWLASRRGRGPNAAVRQALEKWYGPEIAKSIKNAEAFEVCEYGRQPSDEELKKLFPMLGK